MIYFVCDAGMGSSALGASILQQVFKKQGMDVKVYNCSMSEVAKDADILVVHQMFFETLQQMYPKKRIYQILNFTDRDAYERIVADIMTKTKKDEVLAKTQIKLHCQRVSNIEAIQEVGKMLLDGGYIEAPYIDGMLARDKALTTYIGNDIAIPHGEYEVKEYVKKTGLAVRIYPDGIDWNGNVVRIVIGIAAKNDDHMSILQNIASKLCEMEVVEALVHSDDIDYIHDVLTSGDEL